MTEQEELIEQGRLILAKKIWPSISNKTRIIYQDKKYACVIFPVMDADTAFRFLDPILRYRPAIRLVRIDVKARSGGYAGYNAEIDTLILRIM